MYQTFYIDIDEEIASVIDRLRKSAFTENFFIIPKRALILQSIVNLKLIKREAEKNGKQAIIVTQDEIGISMAQKADLQVRASAEGLEMQRDSLIGVSQDQQIDGHENYPEVSMGPAPLDNSIGKQQRLAEVGTSDFYGGFGVGHEEIRSESAKQEISQQAAPVNAVSSGKQVFSDGVIRRNPLVQQKSPSRQIPVNNMQKAPAAESGLRGIQMQIRQQTPAQNRKQEQINIQKDQRIEKMFQAPDRPVVQPKSPKEPQVMVGKKTKKVFFWFLLLCIIALGGAFAYIYVPSARVVVGIEEKRNKLDVPVLGKVQEAESVQDGQTFPIKAIERDESVTMEYPATGYSNMNGQKAHGKVSISNEYSSEPQQLVSTTRLKSQDGKIFRITKDVIVPGMSTVGGKQEPGVVEVEVMADRPGSDFNIEPSTFTIPGFEGGPKYEKFSAKSSDKMSGGASDGSSAKAVSADDITGAKKKSEEIVKDKIKEKLSAELGDGELLLDEAMEISVIQSASSSKTGETRDTFEYIVKAHVKAITFSKLDIDKIVRDAYAAQSQNQPAQAKIEDVVLDYAAVTPRYTEKDLSMKIHAEISTKPNFDTEVFKKDILGKNSAQIKEILSKYPDISNLDIEFQPQLISRIPQYEKRVTIEIAQ